VRRIVVLLSVFFLLMACSPPHVPTIDRAIPNTTSDPLEVRNAINMALSEHDWRYHDIRSGLIKASKREHDQVAVIYVAYGYVGYTIEYESSQHMQYNEMAESISSHYVKWVMALNKTIIKRLETQ
jgi:hypothetical protein